MTGDSSGDSLGSSNPAVRRGPLSAVLSPEFLSSLRAAQVVSGGERPGARSISGLLFGKAQAGRVDVQSFWPFEEAGAGTKEPDGLDRRFERSLAAARSQPALTDLELAGWFTVHSRESTKTLLKDEIDFHNQFFTKLDEVVLVLRPEERAQLRMELFAKPPYSLLSSRNYRSGFVLVPADGPFLKPIEVSLAMKVDESIYLRTYNVVNSLEKRPKRSWWMFGFKRNEARAAKPEASARTSPSEQSRKLREAGPKPWPEPEHGQVLDLAVAPKPASSHLVARGAGASANSWFPLVAVFLLTAVVTFSTVHFGVPLLASMGRPSHSSQGAVSTVDLGLRVESQGQLVMVSWRPSIANLEASRGGTLTIYDGARQREIHLDAGQVSEGSVLYQPASPNVVFHLQFRDREGMPLEDSVRVLGGSKQASGIHIPAAGRRPANG